MTDAISFNFTYVSPVVAYFTGHFEWAIVTNTVSTPLWFTFRKSVKLSNFDCPSKLQNSIKLDIDKYVTTRTLLCICLPHLLSYFNLYLSLSHPLPCNHPSLCYSTDHCISYQMLRTTPIRKHMYCYNSENYFGPSNKRTVPNGYKLVFLFLGLQSPPCYWSRLIILRLIIKNI